LSIKYLKFVDAARVMRIEIRGAEKLSFREKQAVVLKESGKSSSEIAAALNLSSGTVSTLLNRARSKGYEVVIVIPGSVLGIPAGEDDDNE
jgi:DNA-directed RNA polymerase specialized sigma24 family protein